MSIQSLTIPYLIPDMPSADEVMPFLREIDGNRWYTNYGPLVTRLSEAVRDVHFSGESVSTLLCSTGTAALELGLLTMGLKPGAKVLVPAFTFPASANAIENCGFEPVFCDVDDESWVMTAEIAKEALRCFRIDAVMPVAALGRPLPAGEWDQFFRETGVPVLIDAAPALGNQSVGRHLRVAYSMHATKAFGIGEGGVLACRDADVIERARRICNFGMDSKGQVVIPGSNMKLSEYHAAVGLAQIARWPERQLRRVRIEREYRTLLEPHIDSWTLQSFSGHLEEKSGLVPFQLRNNRSTMPVRLHSRVNVSVDYVQQKLADAGVGTRLWYNPGLHRHPHWEHCARSARPGQQGLTTVDNLNRQLIGLPFHNFLTSGEIGLIVNNLCQIIENREYSASLSL